MQMYVNVQRASPGIQLLSLVLKDPLKNITRMKTANTTDVKVFALRAMDQAIKNVWNALTTAV